MNATSSRFPLDIPYECYVVKVSNRGARLTAY